VRLPVFSRPSLGSCTQVRACQKKSLPPDFRLFSRSTALYGETHPLIYAEYGTRNMNYLRIYTENANTVRDPNVVGSCCPRVRPPLTFFFFKWPPPLRSSLFAHYQLRPHSLFICHASNLPCDNSVCLFPRPANPAAGRRRLLPQLLDLQRKYNFTALFFFLFFSVIFNVSGTLSNN
jgi:hypothetical protein